MIRTLLCLVLLASASLPAQEPRKLIPPTVVSIESSEIKDFETYPAAIKKLLNAALSLTRLNLGYKYGSADPAQGGMDCSGTIYYLLNQEGLKNVPRSSDTQYIWVRKAGTFRAVLGSTLDSFEFSELKPGDLLFWGGTYAIKRNIPVTHTMIYLGVAKSDGLPLMVGASDGRTYRGKKCFGVSVFEFRLPDAKSKSRFFGYARIPGIEQKLETTSKAGS